MMKKILLFVLVSAYSFAQDTVEYNFPKIKSGISIPVVIPMAEINRLINQSINGIIYEDKSYTDNNNDQFKTRVEKNGNIVIQGLTNNRIMISVPLKIWAEKGYGTLGYYAYQSTNFSVVMNFISNISFNNNWTLNTATTTAGFVWKEKPVLDYGKVKIPISSLIESTLTKQQQKFTGVIDQQVKEKMNMQPYLVMAWNQFVNPINISEVYHTWLKISPQSLSATPLKVYANQISATLGVDLYSETFTGNRPAAGATVTTVPGFVTKPAIDNVFKLQTTANIPFTEATKLAEQQFLHKEFTFREGKSKIVIESIKVYGKDEKVVIEAETSGTVNGTSVITGTPTYDPVKKKIVFTDTKFNLKTSNVFQKTLVFLFKGKIINMIEKEYGIPTLEMEKSSRKSIEESLNKEYYKGLFIKGKVIDFRPSDFVVGNSSITAIIDTKANAQLMISGLSF